MMKKRRIAGWLMAVIGLASATQGTACTGITLKSKDGSTVAARTIEWAYSKLNSMYVIVPRGHEQQSVTPDGTGGMTFTARYGYVGLAVEKPAFVTEGMNERGLSAGLFYFPNYGAYGAYDPHRRDHTLADLQLVSYILGECADLSEVKEAIRRIHIVQGDSRGSTVHWRFTESTGRQMILEIIDGTPHVYDSLLGVLTNSPGYEWHLTNLTNYLNLHAGSSPVTPVGAQARQAFGGGSGMLGLPGDFTSPSRFIRAAFFQTTAPQQATGHQSVMQAFHLLNNFDIPIGMQITPGEAVPDIPSATQWTVASDVTNRILYYRTMYNSAVRSYHLGKMNFATITYKFGPLDNQ